MTSKHVLIIEDEPSIADNIRYVLTSEGFEVSWASLGEQGLDLIKQKHVDFVILDVGLPDISGFEVCKHIRQYDQQLPILFLTARGDEIDRVVGLEIGGDDYVVKPFSPRELAARVKVILKRSATAATTPTNTNFMVDEAKRTIVYHNVVLELTAYEYGILRHLLNAPEQVFSREQLMQAIWTTPEESFDRVVDTHIKALRAKLRAVNEQDNSIITHRGIGYSIKLYQGKLA